MVSMLFAVQSDEELSGVGVPILAWENFRSCSGLCVC